MRVLTRLGLLACLCLIACGSDSKSNCTDAGCPDNGAGNGAYSNTSCLSEVPCVNDTQCVSIPGASCNTRTSKCQMVKCGSEGAPCSIDGHCKNSHRCQNGACKFDATPRCYSKVDGMCVEGSNSQDWMADCTKGGGESVSSCPTGRYGICRYKAEGKDIAVWVYTNSAASMIRMLCAFQEGGVYTSGS